MQKIYINNEQTHNIKESNKIIRKVKRGKQPLTQSDSEFITMTRNTSVIDMFFSMPVRTD